MKLLKYSLLYLAPLAPLSAATFVDFEDAEYVLNTPLSDYGWDTSEGAPADQPLAWVTSWNGKAGAIGGWYGNPDAGTFSATVSTPLALNSALVTFDMAITDSTNDFHHRDTFGFTVSDTGGASLATLTFVPLIQSMTPESGPAAEWLVSYSVAGGPAVSTGITLFESVAYSMSLTFLDGEFLFSFANDTESFDFSSAAAYDVDEQSIGGVSFNWTKYGVEGGDNFMSFDNISVIPEPSVALLSGLASLCLFRRRRER